jgi:hypothetical protein
MKQFSLVSDNGDFICVRTLSGFIDQKADLLGKAHLLPPNAPLGAIGSALLECLSHSRSFPNEEDRSFYEDDAAERWGGEWLGVLMEKYKYTSRRSLFSRMDVCHVESYEGKIHILPQCHIESEVWVRRKSDAFKDVIVPANDSPKKIGKAIRLALSRCTTEV